ncbi:MAG TPA: hypothetical protein PLQ21_06780 [Candidatus Kapabacteria bacterium]|nr:hypothetical protein [Candidatus Kapabacteria bacterium]
MPFCKSGCIIGAKTAWFEECQYSGRYKAMPVRGGGGVASFDCDGAEPHERNNNIPAAIIHNDDTEKRRYNECDFT